MILNMNDPKSLFDNIRSTEEEIRLADRNIWPNTSLVPVESRGRYREALSTQRDVLIKRYLELVSMSHGVDFVWKDDGHDYGARIKAV